MALVRNLHTGYVSPQYHVVFDDNFETVFNDGKSSDKVDKMYNQLLLKVVTAMWRRSMMKMAFLCTLPLPLMKFGCLSLSDVIGKKS